MIIVLTLATGPNKRDTIELDSDSILSAQRQGNKTLVTTVEGSYQVLEDLADLDVQYAAGGIEPPTGKDRRFGRIGAPQALINKLLNNNINTLRDLIDRSLASGTAFTLLATTLSLNAAELALLNMKAYALTGYLPPGVAANLKK